MDLDFEKWFAENEMEEFKPLLFSKGLEIYARLQKSQARMSWGLLESIYLVTNYLS